MNANLEAYLISNEVVWAIICSAPLIVFGGCATTTSYPGVYVEEVSSGAHPIKGAPTSITAFVGSSPLGPYNKPEQISSYAEFKKLFTSVDDSDPLVNAVHDFFNNGGRQAVIVRAENDSGYENAIGALDTVDRFNLLCILSRVASQDVPSTVWQAAIQACVKNRAILIIDPPLHWRTLRDIELGDVGLSGESSGNAALYYPRIIETHDGRSDTVAPSGAIAGVIARVDSQKGVWQSPSGTSGFIEGVDGPTVKLSDADGDSLNRLGINSIRQSKGGGCQIGGARPVVDVGNPSSMWKYLPIRRLSMYIEESLYRGTQWVVFEPNDEPLWAQIRLNVGAFMHDLFRQGAFQGLSPHDAYFVKCDKETTTQKDITLGIVNFVVGFAPLKPAEFNILRFAQYAGTASLK